MAIIYIDWTDIAKHVEAQTTITGIQRVAFMIARSMVERFGAERVRISRYDHLNGVYRYFASDFLASTPDFDAEQIRKFIDIRPPANPAPTLSKYEKDSFKFRYYSLVRDINCWIGNERHFEKRSSSRSEWIAYRGRREPSEEPDIRDVFEVAEKGDLLCLMGAHWSTPGIENVFIRLHELGLRVSLLIYDLIPLVSGEDLGEGLQAEFDRWLFNSAGYVDQYLAISKCTQRDLDTYLSEKGISRQTRVVALAQQACKPGDDAGARENEVASGLIRPVEVSQPVPNIARMAYVLCVGTIESRKNIWRLAQAWKRLAQRDDVDVPRLVLAGKPGWLVEGFLEWMRVSAWLEGWIQFVNAPTERERDYLYRNCLFSVTVSTYEGWGLPIGESLWHGKTAVVSNVSSMPEVGGDMVEYCNPHSINSIHDACLRLIADEARRAELEHRIAETRLRTWDDVANDYIEAISST